jgi:alpha-N-arabinofuranosidase
MREQIKKHKLHINRRRFIGKLGIGVGAAALSTTLLSKILKGNERSKEPGHLRNSAGSKKYHVSVTGLDSNVGTTSKPFKTISRAAKVAQSGDTITVHKGIYRERINPPRGGMSKDKRIIYQAAEGEEVVLKGSEVVKGWQHERSDTWQVSLPNSFFGDFNPFNTLISGDWFNSNDREHHTGAVYLNGHWLYEAAKQDELLEPAGKKPLWFGRVDDMNTTIWAQFTGVDPNKENVEVNVRQSVFYPSEPGINYITVRGFEMEHAATPWAPPTAEQIGLIGTHWSRGWVIENNTIRYSVCSGITLGKYGDEFDNKSSNSSEGYVETIKRALKNGWSRENIGHHHVRNNHISHCEQAGIVGSMGAAFCTITGNEIHDIHMRRRYSGMEMGGIKIHGAIDTIISHNHIYRTWRGIWLDWMAQGARVTCNLLHDNEATQDLFVEVNHGPFLIDHNFFLSGNGLNDISHGGAYAHNLFAGRIIAWPNSRNTPYHKAHSTEIAGMDTFPGGDSRFYNNIFASLEKPVPWPERIPKQLDNQSYFGLATYNNLGLPVYMSGNVFLGQAEPCSHEENPLVQPEFNPGIKLEERSDGWYLKMQFDKIWADHKGPLVRSEMLGKAKIPDLPYEDPDGKPYQFDNDYFGNERKTINPFPGPLNEQKEGEQFIKVWPKNMY